MREGEGCGILEEACGSLLDGGSPRGEGLEGEDDLQARDGDFLDGDVPG